jgi:hypothetical protein
MTKEELVKFIDRNYADGEELAWQTVSQGDVGATDEDWPEFIEYIYNNSELGDTLSQAIFDYYEQWLEQKEEEDEDEDE